MVEEFNDDFSDGDTYVPPDPEVISTDSDNSLLSISTTSTSKSYNVGKGNYFPYEQLASLTPENVEKLPHDIDGDKVYKIKTSEENWVKTLQDGQYFILNTSSKKAFPWTCKEWDLPGELLLPQQRLCF